MKMRKRILLGLLTLLIVPILLFGQPDVPPGGGPDPGDGGDRIPITESILLLLAGGVGYGIRQFSKRKNP